MDKKEIRNVVFLRRQGAEDLFREIQTKKVYVRQPLEKNPKTGLYTTCRWLTSSKWSGGYEASSPVKEGISFCILSPDNKIVAVESVMNGYGPTAAVINGYGETYAKCSIPFSYEHIMSFCKQLQTAYGLQSYAQWHKWITAEKPENADTDSYIYGNTENVYRKTTVKAVSGYCGETYFLNKRTVHHKSSGKTFDEYTLTEDRDGNICLEIIGYEYDTKGKEKKKMSIFCIDNPMEKPVPKEELNLRVDENRFFLPGTLHGGNYLLDCYVYENENKELCVEVKYLWPETILKAKENATNEDGTIENDIFIDSLGELAETFDAKNKIGDTAFASLNKMWLSHGVTRTVEELVTWAEKQ